MGAPAGAVDGPRPRSHRTPGDQADMLVKAYTLALAQGVRRAYWYDIWDGDAPAGEQPFGLIDRDGRARPSFVALKNLITVLGAQPRFVAVRAIGSAATILEFSTPGGPSGGRLVERRTPSCSWTSPAASDGDRQPPAGRPPDQAHHLAADPPEPGRGHYTWTPRRSSSRHPGRRRLVTTWRGPRTQGPPGSWYATGAIVPVAGQPVRDMTGAASLDMAVVPPKPAWAPLRLQVDVTAGRRTGRRFPAALRRGPDVPDADGSGQAAAGPWRSIRRRLADLTWTVDSARLTGVFGDQPRTPVGLPHPFAVPRSRRCASMCSRRRERPHRGVVPPRRCPVTTLTLPALAVAALAFWRPSWWPLCLALAGVAPAGRRAGDAWVRRAGLLLRRAVRSRCRWVAADGRHDAPPVRFAGVPGGRLLLAFGVWAAVVTLAAPALFPGMAVLGSGPGQPRRCWSPAP